jgi:peptidyl-prolyl cis-trans isomerase D
MEEVIASLQVGDSAPVETEAGTHLVLVTDRRAGSEVTFEDVRPELAQRMQEDDAAAALLRDVERLRDIAFNAADLDEPAAELEREVARVEGVTAGAGEGAFADPRVLRAAFSEDVLEAGHNSEVLELSPQRFLVLRVAGRTPPQPRPLDAVRDEILAELRESQAQEAASAAATDMLAALREGARVEDLANERGLDWQVELGARRDSDRLPVAVRDRAFSLAPPADDGAVLDQVSGNEAIYLLQLTRVRPGELAKLSDTERRQLRRRLTDEAASVVQDQYLAALRSGADVRVY